MSDKVNVVACPNPFTTEQVNLAVTAGVTIAEVVRQIQPDPILAKYAHIYVDDRYIDPNFWSKVTPEVGQLITVRVVPSGGGDKNPLATILSIAVMAVAVAYGGPAGVSLMGEVLGDGLAGAVGTAVVGTVGSLAVNAIAPPPAQKAAALSASDPATLSISGARNQSGAMQIIPKVLGQHLVTPYYGAPPYTELRGKDQYLHLLFVLGYGPLDITEHKIGETALESYDDYEIEVSYGYEDDPPLTLYPSTVVEDAVGTTLAESTGWVQQTTAAEIEEFNVEISFLSGLCRFTDKGKKKSVRVDFEVEYSPVGADTWTQVSPIVTYNGSTFTAGRGPGVRYQPQGDEDDVYHRTTLVYVNKVTSRIGYTSSMGVNVTPAAPSAPVNGYAVCSYVQIGYDPTVLSLSDLRDPALLVSGSGNFAITGLGGRDIAIAAGDFVSTVTTSISAKTTSAVRHGTSAYVPKGQYDIRVRRITADSADDQIFDTATWSILRSIENTDPVALPGLAKVALVIKATDQLNGLIDQYNCVAKSVLLDWTGNAWVEQPTSNPASIYRSIFQAAGMKEPIADARFDMASIEEWADECIQKQYEYNAVITQQSTPFEVAKNVAAVARASFAMKDGLYSIVRDSEATIAAGPKQWLTPRNTWDVKGSKSFDSVHGLEVSYIDAAAGYRPDQVVAYAPGYDEATATRIDTMELLGVTSHDMAYKQALYYLAVALLRPETHSRMTDVEHLVCSRGDLIRVTDDVALHGLMSARIRSMTDVAGDIVTVTTDEVATMEAGKTYALRIRYADGSGDIYRAIDTVEGETNTFTLSTAIGVLDAPEVGDLLMFGETEQETSDKIVHHIEMAEDLSARVFYVDAAPEVYTADEGTIPAYDPGITAMFDQRSLAPEPPQIISVRSDETAAEIQEDGSFQARVMISVSATAGRVQTAYLECNYRSLEDDTLWLTLPQNAASDCTFYVPNVDQLDEYAIRVRAVSSYGVPSDWVSFIHMVVGKTGTVPSVTDLWVENSTGDHLTFIESDCHIVWTNTPTLWNDGRWLDHYLVEILDKDTSAVLHTEQVEVARFDLSLEKNQALSGGPYREFQVRVTVVDTFGLLSVPNTIQPVNNQAGQVSGVTVLDGQSTATVSWENVQEYALEGYEVHVATTAGFVPSAATHAATLGPNTNNYTLAGVTDGVYFVKVGAFDVFTVTGLYDLAYSAEAVVNIDSTVSAVDLVDFSSQLSKTYSAPVLEGESWTVSLGTTLSWNSHSLWFNGTEVVIAEGSTTDPYIYWDGPLSTTYATTADVDVFQALTEINDDFQIAINYGTGFETGWDSKANLVIGNAKIANKLSSTNFEYEEGVVASGWEIDRAGNLTGSAIKIVTPGGDTIFQAGDTFAPSDATVGATWGVDIGEQPSDSWLLGNLCNPTGWILGNDGEGNIDWNNYNGIVADQEIVLINGPKSVKDLAWQVTPSTSAAWQGGFYCNPSFDTRKSYRFTVYVRRSIISDGIYMGMGSYVQYLETYADNSNPYFITNATVPTASEWYLLVGIIHDDAYTGSSLGISGVYDLATGERVIAGNEWRWKVGYGSIMWRVAHYDNSGSQSSADQTWFTRPRVDMLNGSEPSLESLFNSPPSDSDKTSAAISNTVAVDSGGLRVIDSASGNYAELTEAALNFFRGGTAYKSIKRIETGGGTSGTHIGFSPAFVTKPSVYIFLKSNMTYDSNVPNADQSLLIAPDNVSVTGFDPVATSTYGTSFDTLYDHNTSLPNATDVYYDTSTDDSTDQVNRIVLGLQGPAVVDLYYALWDGLAWGAETFIGEKATHNITEDPGAFVSDWSDYWRGTTLYMKPAVLDAAITVGANTSAEYGYGYGTITLPTNNTGDIVIICCAGDTDNWHGVGDGATNLWTADSDIFSWCDYIIVDNGTVADYSWTGGTASDQDTVVIAFTLHGVDLVNPFGTPYTHTSGTTGEADPPAITGVKDNGGLIVALGFHDDDKVTGLVAPTGYSGLISKYRDGSDNSTVMAAFKSYTYGTDEIAVNLPAGRYRIRMTAQDADGCVLDYVKISTSAYATPAVGDITYLAIEEGGAV